MFAISFLTRSLALVAFACGCPFLAGCKSMGGDDSSKGGDMKTTDSSTKADSMTKKDIIDTATGPGMQEVTTLVTAVKAAGLVDTLKGPGPFTVFAPTNAAFAKLSPGTLQNLLKPENKDKLKALLLYHVHPGDAILAKDAHPMALSTVNGAPLRISIVGTNVMVNEARVIKADVVCSNGVIHWIDQVLMP